MALVLLTPPAAEPITVADAKNHLRIDSDITQDDTLIALLIAAARQYGETLTGRSWITQTWRMRLDGFCPVIELERGKVQAISSINYLDTAGAPQIVDLTTIAKDLDSLPARITPAFGQIWPMPQPQIGAVWIDYTAGYGNAAADVPEGIRQWMFVRVTTLYEHREEVEVVARGKIDSMPFIDGMLDPFRVVTL